MIWFAMCAWTLRHASGRRVENETYRGFKENSLVHLNYASAFFIVKIAFVIEYDLYT